MRYFDEIKKSLENLKKNKKIIFLGQAVNVPETAMHNTLKEINKKKLLEMTVAEEMQMRMSLALPIDGYIQILIYN